MKPPGSGVRLSSHSTSDPAQPQHSKTKTTAAMEHRAKVEADENKPGITSYSLYAAFDPQLKSNILKFAPPSNRKIDPSQFVEPVKLNRKDPWAIRKKAEEEKQKLLDATKARENLNPKTEDNDVKPDLSDQQNPAESTQQSTAAPSSSKPSRDDSMVAPTPSSQPKPKAQPFKKKTRQVFIAANQAARMLKKEEYQSWLLEDASTNGERWIGRYESAGASSGTSSTSNSTSANNDASNYVLFRLDRMGVDFEIIPCHRFYRFTQRPSYDTLGADEAEAAYEKMQKPTTKEDVGRWFMRRRGMNPSSSQSSTPDNKGGSTNLPMKNEENGKAPSSSSTSGFFDHSKLNFGSQNSFKNQVEIPNYINGRRNKFTAVQGSSQSKMNGDDDEGKKPDFGQEGDFDEVDYEAEFDDDEEGAGNLNDEAMEEDEVKELAEKMKREMLAAGKAGDDERNKEEVDAAQDSWFGERADLTKEGKAVKKLLMRKGEDNVYDSDEDVRNPYASEEDESDLEEVIPPLNNNTVSPTEGNQTGSRPGTPAPGSQNPSRNINKVGGSQSTNLKMDKPLSRAPSRSGTPGLPGDGRTNPPSHSAGAGPAHRSRGSSPQILPASKIPHSGTTSPVLPPFLKSSPVSSPNMNANGKRKQHPTGAMPTKEKKINSGPGPDSNIHQVHPSNPMGDQSNVNVKDQIVHVLRGRSLTTKELLSHFKARVRDERLRIEFSAKIKEVATLVNGRWVLKEGL